MVLRLGAGLRKGSGVFKEPEAPRTVQWFPKHSHREEKMGKSQRGPEIGVLRRRLEHQDMPLRTAGNH